jgi:hypothetical protein
MTKYLELVKYWTFKLSILRGSGHELAESEGFTDDEDEDSEDV